MKKAVILTLVALMVLGVAGAAFAGSDTYNNVAPANSVTGGPVAISAKVNPKITLTIDTPDGAGTTLLLDWASIDPANPPADKVVDLTIDSNKAYGISVSTNFANLSAAGITASHALDAATGVKGQNQAHQDTVSLAAATNWWDVEPGTYTGSITYTVTQNP